MIALGTLVRCPAVVTWEDTVARSFTRTGYALRVSMASARGIVTEVQNVNGPSACYRVVGSVDGRQAEAWFCPDELIEDAPAAPSSVADVPAWGPDAGGGVLRVGEITLTVMPSGDGTWWWLANASPRWRIGFATALEAQAAAVSWLHATLTALRATLPGPS